MVNVSTMSTVYLLNKNILFDSHTRNGLKLGGDDPRSNAFHHLLDLLSQVIIKPEYILLENVEGFEISDSHSLLISTIKKIGYNYQV